MAILKYGFERLDELTGGIHPGEFIVLGSRPGAGKTTLALNIAANAARQILRGNSANEQSAALCYFAPNTLHLEELMKKMISAELGIHRNKLSVMNPEGRINAEGLKTVFNAFEKIKNYPVFMLNTSGNIGHIISRIKHIHQKQKVALFILDYIQRTGYAGGEGKPRSEELDDAARDLKGLAKEMSIPMIILSQLEGRCEDGVTRKLSLRDLRDSTKLGQIADTVLLLDDCDYDKGKKLFIAKSENGAAGPVNMIFESAFFKFSEC